jgi:hypothetical protein
MQLTYILFSLQGTGVFKLCKGSGFLPVVNREQHFACRLKLFRLKVFCSLCLRRFLSLSHDVILPALYEDPCFWPCVSAVLRELSGSESLTCWHAVVFGFCVFHQKWGGFILAQISSTDA